MRCVYPVASGLQWHRGHSETWREEEVRNSEPVALFSFAVLSFSQKLKILAREEALNRREPSRFRRYAFFCFCYRHLLCGLLGGQLGARCSAVGRHQSNPKLPARVCSGLYFRDAANDICMGKLVVDVQVHVSVCVLVVFGKVYFISALLPISPVWTDRQSI